MPSSSKEKSGPFIHLDYSVQLEDDIQLAFEQKKDDESLGSSVESGLRNSLHSSYDLSDLGSLGSDEDFSDADSFGSDEELRSWRLDPEESGSDWKMVIESVPDGSISEYNVHQHALIFGKKKSGFFSSLFHKMTREETSARISITKVHADAAKLIPNMLDYMYSIPDTLNISTETASALRHLSNFFSIKALATEVMAFILNDISIENMTFYILSATAFDDLFTLKLCAEKCAETIEKIYPNSEILVEMDPSLMLDVLSSPKIDREKNSLHISMLVSVYCELHSDVMDGGVFEELTSIEFIPKISLEAAIKFLKLEAKLVKDARNESRNLTYLQKRCADTLAASLHPPQEDDCPKAARARKKALKEVPKKVLLDIVSRSLKL